MPAAYLPVAQANTTLCCGTCGYINCPTQLLSQAPGNVLPLSGQLPGSGADFVSTGQNRILAGSMSDPMLSRQVAPVADWNGQLPGGGETATGSMTGQIGILSGSVTTAVAPQVKSGSPTASSNLLAAAAAATNPIVLENQKPGNPAKRVGHRRRRQFEYRRFCHRHQRQSRQQRSTSRSIRIHQTTGSTSIASATMAAWAREKSPPSSTPACRTSLRRCATRRPAWSMPATGPFRHPGTFRRMPCPASISQSSCARTEPPARIISRSSSETTAAQRHRLPDLGHDLAGL